jgi:hypothetical protein
MASLSVTVGRLNDARQYILYSYYAIIVCGFIGNTLNVLVFTQLKLFRANRCALYLTVESLVGIGYIIVLSVSTILQTVYGNDPMGYILVWCRMRVMLLQTLTLTSFFTICFASCDQFFSTNYRFNLRQMCTLKLARCFTFGAGCIWFLHSLMYGLFFDIQSSLGCIITNPAMMLYSSWFFYPILYGPLPIAIASLSSLLAFRNVRRIVRQQVPIVRRRLDQQMTAMVLMRVVFFVIFALPYVVYRIYTINSLNPQSNVLQYAVKQLLQTLFTSWAGVNFGVQSFFSI